MLQRWVYIEEVHCTVYLLLRIGLVQLICYQEEGRIGACGQVQPLKLQTFVLCVLRM